MKGEDDEGKQKVHWATMGLFFLLGLYWSLQNSCVLCIGGLFQMEVDEILDMESGFYMSNVLVVVLHQQNYYPRYELNEL